MSSTSKAICVNVPGDAPAEAKMANVPLAQWYSRPPGALLGGLEAELLGVPAAGAREVLCRDAGGDLRVLQHGAGR
jgi:hypothetical protein